MDYEHQVLPHGIGVFGESLIVNGKKYSKVYEDLNTGNWIGINFVDTIYEVNGLEYHKFIPKQDIIKPNAKGKFKVTNPENPREFSEYDSVKWK